MLPEGFVQLRKIGPFDQTTLPQGLLAEHRLKPQRWGRLNLIEGSVTLAWDDGSGRANILQGPAEAVIPPEVPHHLEFEEDFLLEITFFAQEQSPDP